MKLINYCLELVSDGCVLGSTWVCSRFSSCLRSVEDTPGVGKARRGSRAERGVEGGRRRTTPSHLLIVVVRRQALLDDGVSQYPVPVYGA